MSLVAFGTRIAAVRSIRASVWPEFVVKDSPQVPLDALEDGKVLIAVYTGHNTDKFDARELFCGDPKVTLTMQIFLPAVITLTTSGGPIELDTRTSAADTVLDVIVRRIFGGFLGQGDPWSQMLFNFVHKVRRVSNNSYLVQTDKVRASAREVILDCDVLDEPITGADPQGVWADFIALMRTDTGLNGVANLADWIAAEIKGPVAYGQADQDRIALGLSTYAAQSVGILPVIEDIDDTAPAWTDAIGTVSADPDAPAVDGDPVGAP